MGRLGAALWAMQPLYIVLEVLVGLQASPNYSFAGSTVSDLGNTSCRTVADDLLCSPWHAAMNAGFVWFGCTLALGALLLRAPGRIAWVAAGLGSVGVGLVPVVEDPGLHFAVAVPVFLAQPIAMGLMARNLRAHSDGRWRIAAVAAAAAVIGAVGFAAVSDMTGAFERLALWPAYLWVSFFAISTWGRSRTQESVTAPRLQPG